MNSRSNNGSSICLTYSTNNGSGAACAASCLTIGDKMNLRQNLINHILNAFFDNLYAVEENPTEQKKILNKVTNCEALAICGNYNNLINSHHIIALIQTKGTNQSYAVSLTDRGALCRCADYEFRKKPRGQFCKHIIFLCLALTGQVERPQIEAIK